LPGDAFTLDQAKRGDYAIKSCRIGDPGRVSGVAALECARVKHQLKIPCAPRDRACLQPLDLEPHE
jgi:hypothetical protein